MILIYEDLTYKIRKSIFYVHNHIGFGFDEDSYHQGLKDHFSRIGLPYISKHRETLIHRDKKVITFEYDFLVFDLIILELKAVHTRFLPDHFRQIIEYLKFWNKNLGLLINFGFEKAKIERVPFTEKYKKINEQYKYIKNRLSAVETAEITNIRNVILEIYQIHGLGYGENIYYGLINAELEYREISCKIEHDISIFLDGVYLKNFKMPFMLVNKKYIIGIKSLHDDISSYDIARITSYLRKLKLHVGLFLNFGKQQLQIRGVYTN